STTASSQRKSRSARGASAFRCVQTFSSIAPARVGRDILAGRIAIIAVAVGEIVAGMRGSDRTGQPADHSAGGRAARPSRQEPTEQAANHRTADRARAWIGRGRCWRRGIGSIRRIGIDDVIGIVVRDISRRAVQLLRVIIPDAADVPPPAIAAIMDLVAPASALPGNATAIRMPTEVMGHDRAAREAGIGPVDGTTRVAAGPPSVDRTARRPRMHWAAWPAGAHGAGAAWPTHMARAARTTHVDGAARTTRMGLYAWPDRGRRMAAFGSRPMVL